MPLLLSGLATRSARPWRECNEYKSLSSTSVIRLSLGKLLVNLLQVVKRTNTPLIP